MSTISEAEVNSRLKSEPLLTHWILENGWLRRKFNTKGWPQTVMAFNAIAYVCEACDHHADLSVSWGKFTVKLMTHSAGGITEKDFETARKIEETLTWQPALESACGSGKPEPLVFTKS